jgi:hypothetical protein
MTRWRTRGCAGTLIRLGDEPLVRILLGTSVIIDLADVELGVHAHSTLLITWDLDSFAGLERLLDSTDSIVPSCR